MMDKREQIERALGQLWPGDSLKGLLGLANRAFSTDSREAWAVELWSLLIDALADQAIVIECEVEHDNDEHCPLTTIDYSDAETRHPQVLVIRGTHGTLGKALAIIIPLEDKGGGDELEDY